MPPQAMSSKPTTAHHDPELALAFELALARPLRAIEAALGRHIGESGSADLGACYQALAQVRREAEAAVDLLERHPLRMDQATLRELAASAMALIPAAERERVWIAIEPTDQTVVLDAPTYARSLAALIARALQSNGVEVLLHGHQENGSVTFALVQDLTADGSPYEEPEDLPPTPQYLLALSDFERMGAEVADHAAGPHRCTTVNLSSVPAGSPCAS